MIVNKGSSFLILMVLSIFNINTVYSEPIASTLLPIDVSLYSYSQRINLAKQYVNQNRGAEAFKVIQPLLGKNPTFEVLVIAAQSYAELENPTQSLRYFKLALYAAKTNEEFQIAHVGINKMQHWIDLNQQVAQLPALVDSPDKLSAITEATRLAASIDSQRIAKAKIFIDKNEGKKALQVLSPLLNITNNYDLLLVIAQSYAVDNQPLQSLAYYTLAVNIAGTPVEKKIALSGIEKMHKWVGEDYKAATSTNKQAKVKQSISVCDIYATKGENAMPMERRIDLATKYLEKNQGHKVLSIIEPILNLNSSFNVLIIAAKAYTEIDLPGMALGYFKAARRKAQTSTQRQVAEFGMARMEFWRGNYHTALQIYRALLSEKLKKQDFELAIAGMVKSLAYEDRPITGYRSIPCCMDFTTPQMVVAAAQATLWAEQADITKSIMTKYQNVIKDLDKNSALGRDISNIKWQMEQATHPNEIIPNAFYSYDSDSFRVERAIVDYSHYFSQKFKFTAGLEDVHYRQLSQKLHAKGVSLGGTWRPTRELAFNGKVRPYDYQLWDLLLYSGRVNYKPSDYFGAELSARNEVVETFPSFFNHITDRQLAGAISLNPIPYVKLDGSISQLHFSDTNIRNGYYLSASTVVSTVLGLNAILTRRGYRDRFVTHNYFSPDKYTAENFILRVGSKTFRTWDYYIDGGIGRQLIIVKGVPSEWAPTKQWGAGINGPLTDWIILNAYYAMTTQASSFQFSSDYKYQYGGIALTFLL